MSEAQSVFGSRGERQRWPGSPCDFDFTHDMGLLFVEYLSGPRIYECSSCHAHLADYKHIISKVMSYFVLVFSFLCASCVTCAICYRPGITEFGLEKSFQGRHGRAYLVSEM